MKRKVARVADRLPADDFAALVVRYREWLPFDRQRSPKAERVALQRIVRDLGAAAECLKPLTTPPFDVMDETPARAAWRKLNVLAMEDGMQRPVLFANEVRIVLIGWAAKANEAIKRVPTTRSMKTSARRMTADLLIAKRASHGLESTSHTAGVAVAELIDAAKAAGDSRLTKDAASKTLKAALKTSGPK